MCMGSLMCISDSWYGAHGVVTKPWAGRFRVWLLAGARLFLLHSGQVWCLPCLLFHGYKGVLSHLCRAEVTNGTMLLAFVFMVYEKTFYSHLIVRKWAA
jgi:hypothetical protein